METTPPTTGLAPEQNTKRGGHVLAFLGGVFILFVGLAGSLGASIIAPVSMVIASAIWEHRGRKLSAAGHWLAALCGTAIVFVLFGSVVTSLTSKESMDRMRHVADSVQKESAQQRWPSWLRKIVPSVAARPAQARPKSERMQAVSLAFGAAFAMLVFVGFYGSIGWAGGMLVGYGANGHWPGAAARAPSANSAASSLA